MSDKSFGDYANRNIVKNPLLCTAVTGLSIEDLTHNAVLVPVAPNQGLITGSDQTGTNSQTLAHTDYEHTNFPSGDSNPNILHSQPPTSTTSHSLDSQTTHHFDKRPELPTTIVSKALSKAEDDFDVNEYFARLQGTRYVSAPLHSHPDQTNLTETEENLEEINLNDDKSQEVQQSLTADIAQNFSQLPNVLPHVASAVFSSFSNMWNMKSREQTPDDRGQSYQDLQFQGTQGSQQYQEVQFQGNAELNPFQSQGFGANVSSVPLMKTEDVAKEVAPPPKEPPICGTSNFRLATKKKYAQIPGLTTREPQQIAFNPLTQNVPSYFIPTENVHPNIEENRDIPTVEHSSIIEEQTPRNNTETYNIFTPIDNTITGASDCQPNIFMAADNRPKLAEETPPSINLQNEMPAIPPPPMFSTQRRENPTGKSVLPPSVARRLGSNHPVIKQQVMQPPLTDNIFIPTFDPTTPSEPIIPTNSTRHPVQPILPTNLPPTPSQQSSTGVGTASPINAPPFSATKFTSSVAPIDKTAPYIFEPAKQTTAAAIFTPSVPDYTMNVGSVPLSSDLVSSSAGPTSLPPFSNMFSSIPAAPQAASTLPTATTVASYPAQNPVFFTPPTSTNKYPSNFNAATTQENLPPEPLKPLVEPPKTSGASNFRMTKKRPQYYSGPIEGFGSISNNIKPVIPTVDSGTFQGALFTPEQPPVETNAPSFDINQQTEIETSNTHFGITNSAPTITAAPFANQALSYPNYDAPQPYQDYGQQYNTSFDLTRSDTSYEPPEEPKESKGFGIIGSLKSKLSSIDINKIQSSVTTFFDPGYKDVIKDDVVAQQNVSYDPPQYGQIQSNFDIFMPNTEQTMPNSSSMLANQNTYGQMNYDPSSQYNAYHQQNLTYADNNYSYQTYPTSYYSEPTQNQQSTSNTYMQSNTTETIESTTVKYEDKGNTFSNIIDVNKTIDNCQIDRTPISQTVNLPAVEETCIKDYFKSESSLQPQSENKYEENTSNLKTSEPTPILKSNIFESVQAEAAPTGYRNICPPDIDTKAQLEMTSTAYDHKANVVKGPQHKYPQPIGSEAKAMFHDDAKSNISGYGTQNVLFPVVAQENIRQDVKSDCVFPSIEHDTKEKDEIPLEDNLLQSLTKEQVPILSVSSVPLFGLAAIVTDKLKNNESNDGIGLPLYERVKNKDIEDKQASISFFENIGTAIQKEHDDIKNDGILDACLEAKPVEHDTLISNVSFFTINQKSEECDSTNKGKNVGALSETEGMNVRANIDAVLAGEENINDFEDTVYIPADIENHSELNICETCREVNKPDETDVDKDDLTWQLIENINSPVQLLNPVEVPLTESDISADRVEFDVNQFEEISHITEETIETLHVQSATELLEDDDITKLSYGWAPGQNTVHSMMHTTNLSKQHDYSYTVDPNIIGFLGDPLRNDKVPTNASDELKAEFIHQEDILPRQMSIPSAPPAEEDSKSDVAGILDVHSIELDAKEDYSVYEEFVIEPSETDDDKIECKEREKTEESELDSFTNRVEKFKNLEEVPDIEEHKRAPTIFEQQQQAQPISMASYFDTGNYAADNHYRNTMCSPSQISIPPGFEEEFKKRLALAKAKELVKTVPETSTQTKITVSVTTAHSVMPFGYNVVTSTSKVVQEKAEIVPDTPLFASGLYNAPESSNISSSHYEPVDFTKEASEISCEEIKTDSDKSDEVTLTKTSPFFGTRAIQIPTASSESDSSAVKMLHTSSLFGSEGVIPQTSNIFESSDTAIPKSSSLFNPPQTLPIEVTVTDTIPSTKKETPILSDPLNFFADSNTNVPTENVNRLASYFSTPPKTDHAKSFFELSQSQNHYKHASSTENYTDLMKDLTSVQNFTVPTDQTIRHVNYFTVEYDVVLPEFNKGDSSSDVLLDTDDKDLESLNHCSYCTALIYQKRYKVRSSMNNSSEERNAEPTMEVSNTDPTNSVTVNFDGVTVNEDTNESISAQAENRSNPEYGAVKHHWFYRVDVEEKSIWRGFSVLDSRALETKFLSPDLNENTLVPTDGGRYDVNLVGRLRIPVYWIDKPTNVRRCSWFYKGTTDPRYVPYTETVAQKLEEEYWHGMTTGVWHRRLVLPNNEVVVMHGPTVMVHFLNSDAFSSPPPGNPFSQLFSFGKRVYRNPPKIRVSRDQPLKIDHLIFLVHGAGEYRTQKEKNQSSSRPRVVRRGCDDSEIEDAEPSSIDHLLLLCHGVGSACDMRFRSVEEVVEDFRSTSLQLVQSHYKNSYDQGVVSRVEVLPISWHAALHSGETGVDRRLAQITLDSIPRLRNFTNDTVLDVLFYTSPVFCQTILNTVCKELNRIYQLFKVRNPSFKGGVSLGGHSLGSVILYDLLCHQSKESPEPEKHYLGSTAGTGRPAVVYPHLEFEPAALYALGSPIAIFECIRGIESLGADFSLPTCKNFFNIFHPYDPIAYRIEPLINPRLKELKPYLIPHHKGRKRMHLELKDTMARVGADLKQKLVESLRNTWNKWKSVPADGTLERVVEEELDKEQLFDEAREELAKERELSTPEMLGHLNCGRRVDYVLQEAPLEMINEYLFAMSSHVGYWESEDTMLLMLREIYSAMGVQPDSTIPQQSMTVQRTRRLQGSPDSPSTSGGLPGLP